MCFTVLLVSLLLHDISCVGDCTVDMRVMFDEPDSFYSFDSKMGSPCLVYSPSVSQPTTVVV